MLCFYKYYLLYNVYICMTELRLYIWRRKSCVMFLYACNGTLKHTPHFSKWSWNAGWNKGLLDTPSFDAVFTYLIWFHLKENFNYTLLLFRYCRKIPWKNKLLLSFFVWLYIKDGLLHIKVSHWFMKLEGFGCWSSWLLLKRPCLDESRESFTLCL